MKKNHFKFFYLVVLLLLAADAVAQTTVVTGTIQDSTGQAYTYGTWQVSFHPNGFMPTQYLLNGQPFTQLYTGTMDVNGLFSVTIADNSQITPSGSQWDFQVCANTNTPCSTVILTISGASQDVSSAINSQLGQLGVKLDPNPNVRPFGKAYQDSEILFPMEGIVYYNVLDSCLHEYTRTGWVKICAGGGGGGTFNCAQAVNGAVLAATSTTAYSCDPNFLTDFFGHVQAQSVQTLAPYNGEIQLTAQNAWQPSALPSGTVSWIAPNVVTTPTRFVTPPQGCIDGQVLGQSSHDTDPTGTARSFINCLTVAVFSLTATSPIVITPSPWIGSSGVVSCPTCSTSTATVQSVAAGNLPPLFTTNVTNPTTTASIAFTLSNAAANTVFGNFSNSSSPPAFNAISPCGDSTHALSYVSGTGFGCQAISLTQTIHHGIPF